MELETEVHNLENCSGNTPEINGLELFLENYNEINAVRYSDTTDLRAFEINTSNCEFANTINILDPEIETKYGLPKIGTCSEVLFYIAMKRKGVYIVPSSLKEDLQKHIDFFVLGFPVDITSIYKTKIYKEKFEYRDSRTLLIPFVKREYKENFEQRGFYQNDFTYAYDLIRNNRFDHEEFLDEVLNINNYLLCLIENSNDDNGNNHGLRSWQFGDVPKRFIREQRVFLQCLSDIL